MSGLKRTPGGLMIPSNVATEEVVRNAGGFAVESLGPFANDEPTAMFKLLIIMVMAHRDDDRFLQRLRGNGVIAIWLNGEKIVDSHLTECMAKFKRLEPGSVWRAPNGKELTVDSIGDELVKFHCGDTREVSTVDKFLLTCEPADDGQAS